MGRRLEQLSKNRFDVIVIGGGIIGAGIAREARLRGLSVILFEKGDFASGTSGKTSGLIHGGIRYLEQGAFGLVHESIQERYTLFHLAPHLVSPIPFLLPIYRGSSRGPFTIRIGMILYNLLAGKQSLGRYLFLSPERVKQLEPNLSSSGLLGAARFIDCQMDDARLCLTTLLSAQKRGAEILNYTEVVGLLHKDRKVCGVKAKDAHGGVTYAIEGEIVINATGAWIDTVCQMEGADAPSSPGTNLDLDQTVDTRNREGAGEDSRVSEPNRAGRFAPPLWGRRIRPTKGIHIVLPKMTERHAVVLSSQKEGRVFFVIPWREYSLVGTTDTDYSGNPDQVTSNKEEIASLLADTMPYFPSISSEKVLASFAALRPLVNEKKENPLDLSRREKIEWTRGGMLVVFGGKYTLFRKIAIRVIDSVIKANPRLHVLRRPQPEPALYGGEMSSLDDYIRQEISRKTLPVRQGLLQHLIQTYGTNYEAVIACAHGNPDLLKPLTTLGYPLPVEVIYSVQNEHAVHLSDFMFRRTRLAHGPHRDSLPLIKDISEIMGAEAGWSKELIQKECEAYLAEIAP